MAKVLVTGATGFVGKRLIVALSDRGHEVYALCRIKGTRAFEENRPNIHYIWGDLRNSETYRSIPADLDAAYYLVHSMSEIVGDLVQAESEVARLFVQGMEKASVRQIVYLGGLIEEGKSLSPHLRSRSVVEKVLCEGAVPVTILRAGIIIGEGSASFEIIRDLCEKLPVMIAPKWLNTPCQPIAVQDVLFYLREVLLRKECENKIFDIGGEEILTFKELLLRYCAFRHLKRYVIDVPFLTPRLSGYWLVFITSVRFSICFYLVESLKTGSVVRRDAIRTLIPHRCLSFHEALESAFQCIERNETMSTWMDSWELDGTDPSIARFIDVPEEGCLKDIQKISIRDSKEVVADRIWRIGGETGYYSLNWAWKLRGFIDRMIGGVGLNRGRRHPSEIRVGDSIDFWRVLRADKEKPDLILFAGMKIPGEAWLEFRLENEPEGFVLVQTATFRPKGILGRLYWYLMLPFHFIIFRKMAKTLAGADL